MARMLTRAAWMSSRVFERRSEPSGRKCALKVACIHFVGELTTKPSEHQSHKMI